MKRPNWIKFRICFIGLIFIIIFLALLFRAFQLQILNKNSLKELAQKQHSKLIELSPRRGNIYDRNLETLAVSIDVQSLYARPKKILLKNEVTDTLSTILGIKKSDIRKKLDSESPFVWIKRKISQYEADRIMAEHIDGIGLIQENKRFYPNKTMAGHLLGFVGVDSQGLEGLELEYDELIKGQADSVVVKRDALGREIYTNGIEKDPKLQGHSLVLTIDKSIQYIVEKELEKVVKERKAKGGVSIVLDPWNGEVLAMAVQPEFNPNIFWKYKPSDWRDRAVADGYEPGSTFKVFPAAAAIESGLVEETDQFFCENGSYSIGHNTIHDVHNYDWLTVKQIIKVSSNIGAVKVGEVLGKDRFYQYITDFGFSSKTGINLPGEIDGLIRSPKRWVQIDYANISFGQGILATPIQLMMAFSAIVNGGNLMRPYVVKKILDKDGNVVFENKPYLHKKVVSKDTSNIVKEMLRAVVEDGGSGWRAKVNGYGVGGKTGTGQKINKETGEYSQDNFLSSFIGFIPFEHPRVCIVVMVDEPKGASYGGVVAAPVFRNIAKEIMAILNVPRENTY